MRAIFPTPIETKILLSFLREARARPCELICPGIPKGSVYKFVRRVLAKGFIQSVGNVENEFNGHDNAIYSLTPLGARLASVAKEILGRDARSTVIGRIVEQKADLRRDPVDIEPFI